MEPGPDACDACRLANEVLHRRAAADVARVAASTPVGQTATAKVDVEGHLRQVCIGDEWARARPGLRALCDALTVPPYSAEWLKLWAGQTPVEEQAHWVS